MKRPARMFTALFFGASSSLVLACGPESPTPASPTAEPTAPASSEPQAPVAAKPDRAAKAKATYLALVAAMKAHDATRVRASYAANAVKGTAGPGGWKEVRGADVIERETAAMFSVAPDIQWQNTRVFQGRDLIVAEYVVSGTHGPSGRRAGVRGIALHWFDEDGKIAKEHVYVDQLTMLAQTGRAEAKAPEPVPFTDREAEWVLAKDDATEEANVVTFKTTWPAKALVTRAFEHADVATGVSYKSPPTAEFATDQAWGFGEVVVAEMQMKGDDGVAKHVVEVAEHANGQLVRASLYSNRLEGMGVPAPR